MDFELAVRGNLFFVDCLQIEENELGLCAGLFSLLKVLDASVCYYRNELGCGESTCTKDLAFDVAYNTERLQLNLPFLSGGSSILPPTAGLVIADILSPCSSCLLKQSGGCSAFCPLYESYHTCDNVDTAKDIIGDFLPPLGETGLTFLEDAAGFLDR